MSNMKIETVHDSTMSFLGKNLFHDHETNMLFWCDVMGGQVFKMDLNNHNKMWMFRILGEKVICFCVPIHGKKDQFIVGAGRRLLLVSWDGTHTMAQIMKVLCEIPVNGVRFNQFKVDKQGRLFFGTMISDEAGDVFDMNKRIGCIYRYTMHDGLVMMKDKMGMANGMCWNATYTKMYFVDSYDLMIQEFDYDLKAGTFTNQKVLLDVTSYCQKAKIFPSGLTMDSDDMIYVTIFGGGKILKINSKTHKVEQEMKLMVEQPTGMEFGDKHLDTLYVVSAGMGLTHEQTYPAGYLTKVMHLGTTGLHMHKFML